MDNEKEKNKHADKPETEDKLKDDRDDSFENSAVYVQDKKSGKWEVRNPAGSFAYNYLYRDD